MESPNLDSCVVDLINVFTKYAEKEGDPTTLTKAELMELLKNEMHLTFDKADKEQADQLFRELDDNKDDVVDFKEFVNMVINFATAVHNFLVMLPQAQ